jgi:hypothetical protein
MLLTTYSAIEDFTRNACKEIASFAMLYRLITSTRRTSKRRLQRFLLTTRTELKKNIQTQLKEMKKKNDYITKWIDFSSNNFKSKYYPGLSISNTEKQFAEVWSERFVADDAETAITEQTGLMSNYKHLCTAMLHVEKAGKEALEAML